jgi:hypothetical protein
MGTGTFISFVPTSGLRSGQTLIVEYGRTDNGILWASGLTAWEFVEFCGLFRNLEV